MSCPRRIWTVSRARGHFSRVPTVRTQPAPRRAPQSLRGSIHAGTKRGRSVRSCWRASGRWRGVPAGRLSHRVGRQGALPADQEHAGYPSIESCLVMQDLESGRQIPPPCSANGDELLGHGAKPPFCTVFRYKKYLKNMLLGY